jgi:hypothetical protein
VDHLTPKDEFRELNEIHKISSLADWSGMKQIVSPLLALATVGDGTMAWIGILVNFI